VILELLHHVFVFFRCFDGGHFVLEGVFFHVVGSIQGVTYVDGQGGVILQDFGGSDVIDEFVVVELVGVMS
jgi:hypothetical protein